MPLRTPQHRQRRPRRDGHDVLQAAAVGIAPVLGAVPRHDALRRGHDIDIPTGYFFGATASTGGLGDNHDVVAMQLRPLGDNSHIAAVVEAEEKPAKHFDHDSDKDEKHYWRDKEGEPEAHQ